MLRDLMAVSLTVATILVAVIYANNNPETWWISIVAMCAAALCCLGYLTLTGDDM